jgi:cytidylate kinase
MSQPKNRPPIVIAIDGTSASGKSTNSKLVAKALNFVHVDTGAMYRAITLKCLRSKIPYQDHAKIAALLERHRALRAAVLAEAPAFRAPDALRLRVRETVRDAAPRAGIVRVMPYRRSAG